MSVFLIMKVHGTAGKAGSRSQPHHSPHFSRSSGRIPRHTNRESEACKAGAPGEVRGGRQGRKDQGKILPGSAKHHLLGPAAKAKSRCVPSPLSWGPSTSGIQEGPEGRLPLLGDVSAGPTQRRPLPGTGATRKLLL